ncbi:ataxin-7 isoform X3 [Protopterus annectens]|nr:ataxin-7 isoform X3 [Protopterus annectens]
MSERADDDVRGEQRRTAWQQQQLQQREDSVAAMATVGERRSLPSPQAMVGQPWSCWVDAMKQHGNDGLELDESCKECGKNREVMRLYKEDMPIFGHYPAHDDFFLVVCTLCNRLVKPQAIQAHYEKRHSSSSKPSVTPASLSSTPLPLVQTTKSKGSSNSSSIRSSGGSNSSSASKTFKPPKNKLHVSGGSRPAHPLLHKIPHEKSLTPSVKVERIPVTSKVEGKSSLVPTPPATASSPVKPSLNGPSIPKLPQPSSGQTDGKGPFCVPSSLEKKQEDTNNKKLFNKRLSDREFDPDIHCGVVNVDTKKPCARSLTCKTHSLTQRRAVQGRKKQFDTLLAEYKSKTREKELPRNPNHQHQPPQVTTPLRETHPPLSKNSQELHQNSNGGITSEWKAPSVVKPKSQNTSLPRPPPVCAVGHSVNASEAHTAQEPPHTSISAAEAASRLSTDDEEVDEKEESTEKLDYHYSGQHPRPAAICTFGSRQIRTGYFVFDRRWDHIRCAFNSMMDKHINSQMWKKIPPASSNTACTAVPHRHSTNSSSGSQHRLNAASLLLTTSALTSVSHSSTYVGPHNGKSGFFHGTSSNPSAAALIAEDSTSNLQSRQVSPSRLPSVPSPVSNKSPKIKPNSKSLKLKETVNAFADCNSTYSNSSSSTFLGKKRKSSSPLPASLSFSSHSTDTFKKNCISNSGSSGTSYHSAVTSSHNSTHSVGLNCATNKTNSLSHKHDQSGRGPQMGSPAEPIKRMSVMMNSSDSTLSLGPFVHHSDEQTLNLHGIYSCSQTTLDRFEGKKRKMSPGSSNINSSSSKQIKPTKSTTLNNIHSKHASTIPGTQGFPHNSLLHQHMLDLPKARP